MIDFPCNVCKREVVTDAIECSLCETWSHRTCAKLSRKQFKCYESDNVYWYCFECSYVFPFANIQDDELQYICHTSAISDNQYRLYSTCREYDFEHFEKYEIDKSDPDKNLFNNIDTACSYYTKETFSHEIKSVNGFILLHLNCRSIKNSFEDVQLFITETGVDFDFIAISESWLHNDEDISDFAIPNFKIFHKNRTTKGGGGVMIYVNDKLTAQLVPHLCFEKEEVFESVAVEVKCLKNKNIIFWCMYRAPNSNKDLFYDELEKMLAKTNANKRIFLCGDFNIDILKHDNYVSKPFIDLLYSFGLYPLITKPTRITLHSATAIDNIFTNVVSRTRNGIWITDEISDHLPIFSYVDCGKDKLPEVKNVKFSRNINEESLEALNTDLIKQDWFEVHNTEDTNLAYNKFMDVIKSLLDKHCPMKRVKEKRNNKIKPWITKGLKKSCNRKNKLYLNFIKNRTEQNEKKYKTYKNKLTAILRYSERDYYNELLDKHKTNIKQTWQVLNQVIRKGNETSQVNTVFKDDRKLTVTDKTKVADLFNDFFVGVGPNLANSLPVNNSTHVQDYLQNKVDHSLFLHKVDEQELQNIVNGLKPKTSTDYNGLDMRIVKSIFTSVSKPFVHICNLSISNGVFPDKMKIAKVIPLFKKGSPMECCNYRPVSLLPQMSKILEKVFYVRLEKFIDREKILNNYQYGFRKHTSTAHALIDLVENITDATDKKYSTIGVFLDLKKAFDTVDHELLLVKLENLGIRGLALKWLRSYLTQRLQYVFYNGAASREKTIMCGVPQGGILSPLLFLLFINDIVNASSVAKLILFADDTNLFFTGPKLRELVDEVNQELKKIEKWFLANKLFLNANKTSYMVFGNKAESLDTVINLCGNTLERVNVAKFLGVLIDSKLTWKNHIQYVKSKLSKCMAILNRVRYILNMYSMRSLYCALFLPYISYCAEVWGTAYSTTINCLVICQKKAIRIIAQVGRNCHTTPLFSELKLLKLKDIIEMKICLMMFDGIRGMLPQNLQCLLQTYDTQRRNRRIFKIQYARTNIKKQCSVFVGAKLYNNLSSHITDSNNRSYFKHMFKQERLQNYGCS